MNPDAAPNNPTFPAIAVRLAALWVLAGASFKLLLGTPGDLPPIVREASPLGLGTTYSTAIMIELVLVWVALVRPKLGWIGMAALYVVFELILVAQLQAGAESCGCFGSKVKITPAQMIGIDSVLLLLMLVSRPWRLTRGASIVVVGLGTVVAAVLPWLLDREVKAPPAPPRPSVTTVTGGDDDSAGATSGSESPGVDPEVPEDGGTTPPPAPALTGWLELTPTDWIGESVFEAPFAPYLQVDLGEGMDPGTVYDLPSEGLWVFWRWTCDHCAKHLEELDRHPPDVPFINLVRLREKVDTETNGVVHFLPAGPDIFHSELPDSVEYVITTPGELLVDPEGTILDARENAGPGNSVLGDEAFPDDGHEH